MGNQNSSCDEIRRFLEAPSEENTLKAIKKLEEIDDLAVLRRYRYSSLFEKDQTLFHIAVKYGNIQFLEELYAKDPDGILMGDRMCNLPIHTAILNNQHQTLRFLIEIDSKLISARNMKRETPLLLAIRRGVNKCLLRDLKKFSNYYDTLPYYPVGYVLFKDLSRENSPIHFTPTCAENATIKTVRGKIHLPCPKCTPSEEELEKMKEKRLECLLHRVSESS